MEPEAMQTNDSATFERVATDERTALEKREVRALSECMTVLPDGPDLFTVVGENGGTYTVDVREGRCTCPDHRHREVTCKHLHRVRFAIGAKSIPGWVDADAVDSHLGEHVEGGPKVAVTDGGETTRPEEDEGLTRIKRQVPDAERVWDVLTNARDVAPDDSRVQLSSGLENGEALPESFLTPLLFAAHKDESTDAEILDGAIHILAESCDWHIEGQSVTIETEILADRETDEIQSISISALDFTDPETDGCGCDEFEEGELACWECYQQGTETV